MSSPVVDEVCREIVGGAGEGLELTTMGTHFLASSIGRVTAPFSGGLVSWPVYDDRGSVDRGRIDRLASAVAEVADRFGGAGDVAEVLDRAGDLHSWNLQGARTIVAFGVAGRFADGWDAVLNELVRGTEARRLGADLDAVRHELGAIAMYFGEDVLLADFDAEIKDLREMRARRARGRARRAGTSGAYSPQR